MTERENMAQPHADSLAETLATIWEAHDAGDAIDPDTGERVEGGGDQFSEDPLEYLSGLPLEVVYEPGRPFAIVFSTGGPHVEIEQDLGSNDPSVRAYWSSDRGIARNSAVRRTADYFREMVEEV